MSTTPSTYPFEVFKARAGIRPPAAAEAPRHHAGPGRKARHASLIAEIDEMRRTPCEDSKRTAHLAVMIGKMLAAGYGEDKCLATCIEWNEQNIERLDDEKIRKTLESIIRTDARNHPERYQGQRDAAPINFDLHDGRVDQYFSQPPPPRRWLLQDVLVLGKTGAIVAPGGSSKSQFLLQLAVGVASGLPVADYWKIGEPGGALMFCGEDDRDEIHTRLYRIYQRLALASQYTEIQLIKDRLRILSTVGRDTKLTIKPDYGEIEQTAVIDAIIDAAKQMPDLKLVVLDPGSRFRGGDENKNEDATRFVEALERIALETGATVLIAHHAGKASIGNDSGQSSQTASRGASAFTDGVRWQLNLARGRQKTATGGTGGALPAPQLPIVTATVTKSNYAAYPEPVALLREDDGFLRALTTDQSTSGATQSEMEKLLRAIDAELKAGQRVTSRWFEDKHGGKNGALGLAKHRIRELVRDAHKQGLIDAKKNLPLKVTSAGYSAIGVP
jgi:RecA-family ATPase